MKKAEGERRIRPEWQAWNWKSDPVSAAVPHIYCLIWPGQRFSGYLRKGRSVPEDRPAASGANISAACEDGFRQGVKELSDEEKTTWLEPQTQTVALSDRHKPIRTFQSTINCTMGVFNSVDASHWLWFLHYLLFPSCSFSIYVWWWRWTAYFLSASLQAIWFTPF